MQPANITWPGHAGRSNAAAMQPAGGTLWDPASRALWWTALMHHWSDYPPPISLHHCSGPGKIALWANMGVDRDSVSERHYAKPSKLTKHARPSEQHSQRTKPLANKTPSHQPRTRETQQKHIGLFSAQCLRRKEEHRGECKMLAHGLNSWPMACDSFRAMR